MACLIEFWEERMKTEQALLHKELFKQEIPEVCQHSFP